jgi:hypothetical protein
VPRVLLILVVGKQEDKADVNCGLGWDVLPDCIGSDGGRDEKGALTEHASSFPFVVYFANALRCGPRQTLAYPR